MDITTLVAIVIPTGGIIAAISSVRQQFLDHKEHDDEQFTVINDMLTEIRKDIKELLKNGPPRT